MHHIWGMANSNGRNVLRPDDNRENGWQPDPQRTGHWEDSDRRGAGQSGYGAGRRDDSDRSKGYEGRNEMSPSYHDDSHEGLDERWTGRGYWQDQRGYNPERRGVTGGYGGGSGFEDRYGRGQQGMPGYGQQSMYAYGQEMPSHRGKGPKNYTRSDDRIREQVCETLADDHNVDASDIEVAVKDGEVTLTGTVPDRRMKRMAEDCIYQLPGIQDVHNQLRAGNRK